MNSFRGAGIQELIVTTCLGLALTSNVMGNDVYSEVQGAYMVQIDAGYQTLGVCLTNPTAWMGTVASQGTNSLTFGASGVDVRTVFDSTKPYYAEIDLGSTGQSDPEVGHRVEIDVAATIAGSNSNQIFLDLTSEHSTLSTLPTLTDYRVRIRQHVLLGEAFLRTSLHPAFDFGLADQVQFYENGSFKAYYYIGYPHPSPQQYWMKFNFEVVDDKVIPPGTGILFKGSSQVTTARDLSIWGEVRESPFVQPLNAGITFVSEAHFVDSSFVQRDAFPDAFDYSFDIGLAAQVQTYDPASSSWLAYFLAGASGTPKIWLRTNDFLTNYNDVQIFLYDRSVIIDKDVAAPDYLIPAP